jgi:hypothetical protein
MRQPTTTLSSGSQNLDGKGVVVGWRMFYQFGHNKPV